ncbi:MAG: hypothetical protein HQK85_04355 [Nitrospinae bacterium]|nr:hypothetical protein [Nitrospinota bacterium]
MLAPAVWSRIAPEVSNATQFVAICVESPHGYSTPLTVTLAVMDPPEDDEVSVAGDDPPPPQATRVRANNSAIAVGANLRVRPS